MITINRATLGLCGALMTLSSGALGAQSQGPPPGWEWRQAPPASARPRVLVVYDMEGLAGVDRYEMTICHTDSIAYQLGREHLAADVNAVVEGLVAGGASEIGVIDRHGSGCESPPDLPVARLHPSAKFFDESGGNVTSQPWEAVVMVGAHASPGTGGFLEHTGTFGNGERILNGVSVTETEVTGLGYGPRGIPIIFASGDDRLRKELSERMPWVVYVEVKRATGRMSAELRLIGEARADLRSRAQHALETRSSMKIARMVAPFTGGFRPVWPHTLEPLLAAFPELEVHDGVIPVSGATGPKRNEALERVQRLAFLFAWADRFWEAVKDNPDLERRADSVFMARWAEGPPASTTPRQ